MHSQSCSGLSWRSSWGDGNWKVEGERKKHGSESGPSRIWSNLCRRQCRMISVSGRCEDAPVPTVLPLTSLPLRGKRSAQWLCSPSGTASRGRS